MKRFFQGLRHWLKNPIIVIGAFIIFFAMLIALSNIYFIHLDLLITPPEPWAEYSIGSFNDTLLVQIRDTSKDHVGTSIDTILSPSMFYTSPRLGVSAVLSVRGVDSTRKVKFFGVKIYGIQDTVLYQRPL